MSWDCGLVLWLASRAPAPGSLSPSLPQYVNENPPCYKYEPPSPELCKQIQSIRSVQRWTRCALPSPSPRFSGHGHLLWHPLQPSCSGSPCPCRVPSSALPLWEQQPHRGPTWAPLRPPSWVHISSQLAFWFCRLSKAMMMWASWIVTERDTEC